MRKNHWKAVAIAAVFMMTMSAFLALAADKTAKAKPAAKTTEQMMPGCTMHGGADGDAGAGMPGCSMKGGMGKGAAGCCAHGDKKGCGVKGAKGAAGCCAHGDMKGCGMKGAKGAAGCCAHGDMKGCGMKGAKGAAGCCAHGDMKGCGMKGAKGAAGCCKPGDMKVCVTPGARGKGMPGCGMEGGMGGGMAAGPMGGPGMGCGMGAGMGDGHGAMMLRGLDLTADQQKKVASIHEKQARSMVQAQADVRIATMDLQQLMRAETPDKAKIDAQIDRIAQLRAGMQKSRTATRLEVRALLTPEQLKKLQSGPMGAEEEDD